MSWLSDIVEKTTGLVTDINLPDNFNKALTSGLSNAGKGYVESRNQDAYLQSLRDAEQRNYDESKAYYDAYNAWAQGNAASRSAAAASSAAAARATEAARQGAAKKSLKQKKKGFAEIGDLWKPYMETGKELLPVMTNAYKGGAETLGRMQESFKTPEFEAKTRQSVPSWMTGVPIPDYLLGRKA